MFIVGLSLKQSYFALDEVEGDNFQPDDASIQHYYYPWGCSAFFYSPLFCSLFLVGRLTLLSLSSCFQAFPFLFSLVINGYTFYLNEKVEIISHEISKHFPSISKYVFLFHLCFSSLSFLNNIVSITFPRLVPLLELMIIFCQQLEL